MIDINILYVDEELDQLENFQADADLSNLFDQVVILEPKASLEDMVDEIISLKVDAVVSDFALNQAEIVSYNGDQLLNAIQEVRPDFPCFLRTSYEEAAVCSSSDVNRVYVKEESMGSGSKPSLFDRIAAQVKSHKSKFIELRREHSELREKLVKDGLDFHEAQRFVELDSDIESYLSADEKTPSEIKMSALEKFDNLMRSTDELIQRIEKDLE